MDTQLMTEQIAQLRMTIDALSGEFYKNNFSATQDFNKISRFNTRLKVPHYSSTPSTCEVGELCEVGGVLYIGSASNTWQKVGAQ